MLHNWLSALRSSLSFNCRYFGLHRTSLRRGRGRKRTRKPLIASLQVLEDRTLLTVSLSGVPDWIDLGSKPIIEAGSTADPDNPASGAVEDVAIDPNNPARIFAGTVNGGIWRTLNGNLPYNGVDDDGINGTDDPGEQPDWEPLTDDYPSLSIGDIRFDPLDPTGNTIFAGTGSTSSLSNTGGVNIGVMRTTDGGGTWEVFAVNPGNERQIRAVLPTTFDADPGTTGVQQVVLVGTTSSTGLYRSADGGETYAPVSGTGGLPTGAATDLIVDPNNASRFYAGVVGSGVFFSVDGGVNWSPTDNATLTTAAGSTVIQLGAHPGGGTTVLYTLVSGPTPTVYTSNDGGTNWTPLAATPAAFANATFNGLYTDMAADQLIVDPSDSQVVYISRGYGGANKFYRYDPSGGGSWVQIDDSGAAGNTSPHADQRDLQFTVDNLGNDVLIATNDGGIYFIEDPQNASSNEWTSLHGRGSTGLGVTEYTNVTWDSTFNVAMGGAQDNGTSVENGFLDPVWTQIRGADGGDAQVDTINAGAGQVFRYSGTQPPMSDPQFSPLQRETFSSATGAVPGSAISIFPTADLAGFNPYFTPLFELNTVDPSRLVTGGSGSSPVYELLNAATTLGGDVDANWQAVPVGAGFGNVNNNDDAPFVYGGRLGGVNNPEVLIVGSGGNVFVRSTAGGMLTNTPTPFPGGTVQGIAADPQNWQHFFVADSSGVWETTNAGMSWNPLTRNLGAVNSRLQSVAFIPTPTGGVVLVGGNFGVSRLSLASPTTAWSRFGAELPNALVSDLEYTATDDVLLAGTFGRGTFALFGATFLVQQKGVLEINGDMDFAGQDDVILLVRDEFNPDRLNVFVNGVQFFDGGQPFVLDMIEQINVNGLGGNDTLIVDSTNGLITVNMGIRFDGGAGFDRLRLEQIDGTEWASDRLVIGATNGTGISFIGDGVDDDGDGVIDSSMEGDSQVVEFQNLEPVIDLVPTATFNITSIPGLASLLDTDNAITYTASQIIASGGRVTVDAFEPIEFRNKTALVIDARAGRDNVVLNNAATPTGLTTLTVNAGDGNDTIEVIALPDASAGGATFTSATLRGDSGNDTINAGALVVNTPLTLFGDQGDDTLIGGRGSDSLVGGSGSDLLIGGDPAFSGQIGSNTYDGGGDFDTIGILGTFGNDTIDVIQTSANTLTSTVNGNTSLEVFGATNVEAARIVARAGDDTIRVTIADILVAPAGNPDDDVLRFEVVGDAPDASDRLIYQDDGIGDTIIQRKAPDGRSGTIALAPAHPNGAPPLLVYEALERVDFIPLNAVTGGLGSDGLGRLIVFKNDPFEGNGTLLNATHIGAGTTINVDPTIDPGAGALGAPADEDWYQFVAAETGGLDFQVFFREVAALANGRSGLPGDGNLDIEVRDSTGDLIGPGSALVNSGGVTIGERIAVPVVRNETYYLRIRGATGAAVNLYNMTAINVPAPVPQTIDLQAASDSGRHDSDDVTNVALATFDVILNDDRIDEFLNLNLLADTVNDDAQTAGFDYGVEVFNNGASIGFAFYTGVGNTWQFTAGPGDLLEGHNNFLTAAVWVRDRATPTVVGASDQQGPINALQITLDTIAPPAPTITLDPPSDTGVPGVPATFVDRITSDTTPGFVGNAEADSIVRVFANANSLGLTVAIPLDGDDAFPNGQWELDSHLDLNNPVFAVRDGLRIITATAEDLAGNVGQPGRLDIFLDTQGPQVFDPDAAGPQQAIQVVTLGVANPNFDLFDIKPTAGPTPRVDSLLINIQDNPNRDPAFPFDALLEILAENPDLFRVVGDRVGVVPIVSVDVTLNPPVAGQPATATIQLNFAEPLEDDRFSLTIFELLTDPAGNLFDGESNALLPIGNPLFPSGNAIPGVSFGARFTVDSRPEVGVHGQVGVTVDANQNFHLDPTVTGGVNIDITRDLVFQFGLQTDAVFAGQFTPPAVISNGFDRLGAYGLANGAYRFLLDYNDDGVPDTSFNSSVQVNALPLAGDFDNDDAGDELGLFDGVNWYLDANGDNALETSFAGNMRGLPFAGDFDGDGLTDLATHVASSNTFFFDLAFNGLSGNWDRTIAFGFPGVLERPFAGDFNLDGVDDIGLTTPSQTGSDGPLEWYILVSRGVPEVGWVNTLDHPFSPTPVGGDFAGQFGSGRQVPVVGNFDPPLSVPFVAPDISGSYTFNGSTQVTQSGSSLTFTNEHGGKAPGRFLSATQVIADGWGGLIGNLVDGRIDWANGTSWTRPSGDISGQYTFNGRAARVQQAGGELTFINENGGISRGRYLNASQVVATDWGNLTGNLGSGNIQWANGTTWTTAAAATPQATPQENSPQVGGTYTMNGRNASIQQTGDTLVFVNENGGRSNGRILNASQVVATDWGGLVGTLVNGRIEWANGSTWTLLAPTISGGYLINGQSASVAQSGSDLTFTNEHGGTSRGRFLNTSLVVATDWGNLTGSVINGRIEWANGTRWESTVFDSLFESFDDWYQVA